MAVLGVIALFTNVPAQGPMEAIDLPISDITSEETAVRKPHFLRLVELCLGIQAFNQGCRFIHICVGPQTPMLLSVPIFYLQHPFR